MPQTSTAPVWEHVLQESLAMAKYAFAAGMKVPPGLSQQLEQLEGEDARPRSDPNAESTEEAPLVQGADSTPPVTSPNIRRLTIVHNRLADLVSPATPKTILLLATEEAKGKLLLFLGAVPLIRRLMAVAIVSMIGFVIVSLSEKVDGQGFDLLKNSGSDLLLSELFLLLAASIGASFSNLFEAQRYIKDGTFDPKYESSYWVRYVLGLMAGTILALLIPIEAIAASQEDGGGIVAQLGKPILALLGGFAAAAVYRILNRLVAALESLVSGDTRDITAAQEKVSKVRLAERETQNRMNLSLRLIALEEKLATSDDPDAIRTELKRIQHGLIKGEEEEVEFNPAADGAEGGSPKAAAAVAQG